MMFWFDYFTHIICLVHANDLSDLQLTQYSHAIIVNIKEVTNRNYCK